MPQFSIITVTWNDLSGLRETAESVRGQISRDFEWIIVDGASVDGTVEAAAAGEFEGAIFLSEPDSGLYDAMNKGLDVAIGEYVIFMNGGDTFADPDVLHEVSHTATFGTAALIYGDAWEVEGPYSVYKPAFSHRVIPYTMFAHHQSMFYRNADIGPLRYDLTYRIGADWVFTAQQLRNNRKASALARPICRFKRGGLSQSRDPSVLYQVHLERVRALREVFNIPRPIANVLLRTKEIVEMLRRRFPTLYDRLRMRRI